MVTSPQGSRDPVVPPPGHRNDMLMRKVTIRQPQKLMPSFCYFSHKHIIPQGRYDRIT